MSETIHIERRFNGPPNSGHGGYVCGAIADCLDGIAEVTLRKPLPLDRDLRIEREGSADLSVWDGETLIAEARPSVLDLDVPPPPDARGIASARARHGEFMNNEFGQCFACGAGREEGDGLRLLTGPVDDGPLVASRWTPHDNFAGPGGIVPPRILWSALDCPGVSSLVRESGEVMYLGRLTAEVDADLAVGTPCTVIGWPLGREGRKARAGTAILDGEGRVRGRAEAVWIKIDKQA